MNNKKGNELNIENETDISVVMCDGELIVNIYKVWSEYSMAHKVMAFAWLR